MTPTEIKSVLASFGGGANKRLGQHFLIDRGVLEKIVESADIHPGDLVLEIGPGLGVLTRALLDKGAEVIAIEQDRRFVEYLDGAIHESPLRVIHGDAATIHWHEHIGDRPWKLVANLPYSITSLALRKALWAPKPPLNATVLIQREVAERAIALSLHLAKGEKKRGSLLSLMVALAADSSRIVTRVARGAFFPPPKVESVVLQVIPMPTRERFERWGIDPEKIMEIAKRGFAHPRKLLTSNLGIKKFPIEGITQKARAEELSPEDWARLAKEL